MRWSLLVSTALVALVACSANPRASSAEPSFTPTPPAVSPVAIESAAPTETPRPSGTPSPALRPVGVRVTPTDATANGTVSIEIYNAAPNAQIGCGFTSADGAVRAESQVTTDGNGAATCFRFDLALAQSAPLRGRLLNLTVTVGDLVIARGGAQLPGAVSATTGTQGPSQGGFPSVPACAAATLTVPKTSFKLGETAFATLCLPQPAAQIVFYTGLPCPGTCNLGGAPGCAQVPGAPCADALGSWSPHKTWQNQSIAQTGVVFGARPDGSLDPNDVGRHAFRFIADGVIYETWFQVTN